MAFPNVDAQFKPGNHLGGRTKGTRNFSTIIREMVENPRYKVRLKDGTVVKNPGVQIAHAMVVGALSGDVSAATWLSKYGYGDKQDITSNGETVGSGVSVNADMALRFAQFLLESTKAKPEIIEGVVTDTTPGLPKP